jgi:hypothetical protein
MIRDDDGVYVDRWAQAKYAMEVFAAMLDPKDTMRVYYMSDFDNIGLNKGKLDAPHRIEIKGSASAKDRVDRVHETVTESHNTPYDTVAKAFADLKKSDADEKSLVVMTDGEYNYLNGQLNENIPVNDYFKQYIDERSDLKIYILAMGTDFKTVFKEVPGRIFLEQAKDSKDIRGKITSICFEIFGRNKLDFTNEAKREFYFDVSMKELLVFAQGDDVKVNGIKGSGSYKPSEAVNVRYSEKAATSDNFANNPNVVIPRELTGVVAFFRMAIPKGTYSLDITGADKVEVYYKPDVGVDIKLLQNRREVRANNITEGKYRVQFSIVDDKGKPINSSLIGDVEYTATVQNNGKTIPVYFDDPVNLEPGELKVHVQARFLKYITADNTLTRKVSAQLSFKERLRNWIQMNWPVIKWLLYLLLGLFLIWFLWGTKKRFPKYMSGKPDILIETDENTIKKYGSFKINPETKWIPRIAQTGRITAVADGKPLPQLRVKAAGGDRMELTNASDFTADKLRGIDFYISDQPIPEGSSRSKEMSCTAQIKSVFYSAGSATTHTCSFAKKGKGRKK